MLVAFSHQFIDVIIDMSIENETIELTDLQDDLEEEEDLFEDHNLISYQKKQLTKKDTKRQLAQTDFSLKPLCVFIQIPSPPPELV